MKEELADNLMIFPAKVAIKLYSKFRAKVQQSHTYWRGAFELFPELAIDVTLFKKVSEEKLPSLKKYSKKVEFDKNEAQGKIKPDKVQYLQDDNLMNPVGAEDIIKGYFYGK